jgi:hypothetical protein
MQQRAERLDDIIILPRAQAVVCFQIGRALPRSRGLLERALLFLVLSALWGLALYTALSLLQ